MALDIPVESFNDHFKDTLERARSAGIARETLQDFLTKKHSSGSTIFFSSDKWVEEIEGLNL